MKYFYRLLLAAALILFLGNSGCEINGTPDANYKVVDLPGNPDNENGDNPGSDQYANLRMLCVETINEYRATEGKPPYARWAGGENCADEHAKYDSEKERAHAGFADNICNPGGWAQNSCLGRRASDIGESLKGCLASMWDEKKHSGEQGHYRAMSSDRYEEVACGFYKTPEGEIWMLQNFQ